ncbi:MAG: hypothetical protein R8P61_20015 [Bacteroidia bacterium]|nr:hypothetical protein [Bacteroidia bacterium]
MKLGIYGKRFIPNILNYEVCIDFFQNVVGLEFLSDTKKLICIVVEASLMVELKDSGIVSERGGKFGHPDDDPYSF